MLNLRLLEEIEADTFAAKNTELRDKVAQLTLQLESADRGRAENAEMATRAFELSQSLTDKWVTADHGAKRHILEIVCLNFRLDDVTLVPTMRKPFDVLAEGLVSQSSRGDWIRTSDLLTPSQTRYPGCATPRLSLYDIRPILGPQALDSPVYPGSYWLFASPAWGDSQGITESRILLLVVEGRKGGVRIGAGNEALGGTQRLTLSNHFAACPNNTRSSQRTQASANAFRTEISGYSRPSCCSRASEFGSPIFPKALTAA